MATLNANQARRITSTFSYIDDLLQNVERLARAQRSAFSRERPDLSDIEARLLLALVDTARTRMLATLDHLGLPRPRAEQSARWSIMTGLRFVDISLSELTPQTLVGYGKIDGESAMEVSAVTSELRDLVERGRELLQPHEGEKLRERLATIEGPFGEILRCAEKLSTNLGLVEVRSLIAAAAERATTSTIDIGIFGRVSSGKSSLINALVGVPLLPVGATPVTAVPLRVVSGDEAIYVFFDDGHEEPIEASKLPDFATESGNRDNSRGVRSILIRTPRLPEGLALLDTPGVGSLSVSGPPQAFAWLPRCDLGIVLAAAGTPIGGDELALVNGLTNAGIAVELLLSKSDLIHESERPSAIAYIESELERSSHPGMKVRAVSVAAAERHLLEKWREEELDPLVAARHEVAEESRARRLRGLLGALNSAMLGRLTLERATVDLQRARLDASSEIDAATDDLESSAPASLARAADAAVAAWHINADASTAVRHVLLEAPGHALLRARSAADQVFGIAHLEASHDMADRIPPLFDPEFLDPLPITPVSGVLGQLFARGRATRQLALLTKALDDAYRTYAGRVRAWGQARLEENFESVTALRPHETQQIAPQLLPLARLIDKYFPAQSSR